MSKQFNSAWFKHDYNSRNDRKLVTLRREYGMEGIGIYWTLVEMMYENNGFLPFSRIKDIAFELRIREKKLLDILENYELFQSNFSESDSITPQFYSESILKRLGGKMEKSVKARESADKRWNKDANALRTQCDDDAIRVDKIREEKSIKENTTTQHPKKLKSKAKSKNTDEASFKPNTEILQTDIETRKEEFKKSTYHLVDKWGGEYDASVVKQFFEYWSKESIADNRYMFFEYEESFDVDVRMAEFAKRNYTSFERPKGLMKTQFLPPTQKEVQIFFDEKGYKKDAADKAFIYYDIQGWIDANKKPVENWKSKMVSVWFKTEDKKEKKVQW